MAKNKKKPGQSEPLLDLAGNPLSPDLMSTNPQVFNQAAKSLPIPPTETNNTKKNPTNPEVFRDQDTGKLSGITLPDGRTILGLKPSEVRDMTIQFQQDTQLPAGTQPGGTAQREANTQQSAQGVIGQPSISEQDVLNAVPQEPTLEGVQTGAAAIGGAIAGAGAGTLVAPGIGTVIGALAGLIGASYGKITLKQRGDAAQASKVGTIASKNFGQTIDALNAGILPKDVALRRWREDKISLYAARENLKRLTSQDLDRFLSGGADELAKIEDQIRDLETIYEPEFILALSAPNPNNIKYSFMRETENE